jgi:hypothetical protein
VRNVDNLQAACTSCNYAGGAHIAANNRRSAQERILELEQENQRLERIVECERLFMAPLTIEPMSTTMFSAGAVAHVFAAHP